MICIERILRIKLKKDDTQPFVLRDVVLISKDVRFAYSTVQSAAIPTILHPPEYKET